MRIGATLLELLVVVGLASTLAGLLLPAVGGARDRLAVRSAQSAFAAAIRTARLAARTSGGALVRVDLDSARVALLRPGEPDEVLSLVAEFGVIVDAPGTRSPVLRFDALGLGRFANRTFTLSRGRASRAVVVSSYGRVDRR